MGYYHIRLIKEARNLFTIILPWGKYKYKRLPMGVCKSLENSEEKMNEMFSGIEFIRAYIYDLLIFTKGDWFNHLNKLELVMKNITGNWLKCTIKRSFFGNTGLEYMGFCMT